MKIELNIEKKHLYVIIGLFVILLGVIGVVALGTSNPQLNGHDPAEILGLTEFVQGVKVNSATNADNANLLQGWTVAQIQASSSGGGTLNCLERTSAVGQSGDNICQANGEKCVFAFYAYCSGSGDTYNCEDRFTRCSTPNTYAVINARCCKIQ